LLCEHSPSGEVAGLTVDAPWIPVAFAVGHAGWPKCVAGAVMPVRKQNLRLWLRLGGLHGTRGYEYAPPEKGVKTAGRRKVLEGCLGVPCIERQHYHFHRVALSAQGPQGLASTRYSIWLDPLPVVTAVSFCLLQTGIVAGLGFIAPYVFLCNRCNGCNR